MRLFNKKNEKMNEAVNSQEITVVKCDCSSLLSDVYVVYGLGMYFIAAGIFRGAVAFQLAPSSGNRKLPKFIAIETKSRNPMDTLGRNALALACKILTYSWLTNGIWPEHSFSDYDIPALNTATLDNIFKQVTTALRNKSTCRMSVLFKCYWVNDAIVMICSGSTGVALRVGWTLCSTDGYDDDRIFYSTDGNDEFYARDDLNRLDAILGLFDHLHKSVQCGSPITDSDLKEQLLCRKQCLLHGRELMIELQNNIGNRVAFVKDNNKEFYLSDTIDGIILSIGNESFHIDNENFRGALTSCILMFLHGKLVSRLSDKIYFDLDAVRNLTDIDIKMKFNLQPNGKLLFSYGDNEHTFLLSRLNDECISIHELNTSRLGVYTVRQVPFNVSEEDTLLYYAIELCLRIATGAIGMDTLERSLVVYNASHIF